ncbi:TSUP family transporter [bacterium]|nr:TSUP family transporter [bacterium]
MLAAGLVAGFVAGMFGIGGGFVVVPALAAVLTILPGGGDPTHIMHVAIGTSLATIFFTSLRSVQAHAKRGAVDWTILKGWLPWVAGGVVIGVALTGRMDGSTLKLIFGLGVLVMGLHFIFPVLSRLQREEENMPKGAVRAGLGSVLGAFCALLGIGGGTPAVLIMTLNGVNIHRAVATAAGFGTIIAVPGAIGSMIIGLGAEGLPAGSVGFVNLIALAAITAMSIITAPMGAAAAHSLDPRKLKRIFGVYLVVTSVIMLSDSPLVARVISVFSGGA